MLLLFVSFHCSAAMIVQSALIIYIYMYEIQIEISSLNCVGGVMVSVFISSAVDRVSEPPIVQSKDYKLVFVVSLLSMQH